MARQPEPPSESVDSMLRAVARASPLIPPPVLEPGTVIADTFRIERRLGAGGMGVVYLARDLRLHRDVALKLHLGRAEPGREQLMREARVMARLAHPNVITVYEVGALGDRVFIAMEYLEGGTLQGWLDAAPRSWRDILGQFLEAARGLIAAHDAGLVNQDFKPDNVLLRKDGHVCVADFGLASSDREPGAPRGGTAAYMAPEQRAGGVVDARADQYAFAVALTRALGGREPAWLRRILARGSHQDPARRWPTLRELVAAVAARRRRGRAVAMGSGLVALLIAAVITTALVRRRSSQLCRGSQAALAATWSPALRARVAAAARPWLPTLERYARDWVAQHREACVATRVRGQQSEALLELRMACLEGARAQLGAVADKLAGGTPPARASLLVSTLPAIARCGQLAFLRSQEQVPTEPTRLATTARLIRELGLLRTEAMISPRRELWARGAALHAEARALGWRPVLAEIAYLEAELHLEIDDPGALPLLQQAVGAALAGSNDVVALFAVADLARVLADGHRGDDAQRWLQLALDLLPRFADDPRVETRVQLRALAVWLALGRFEDAAAAGLRAVARARQLDDPGALALAELRLASALVQSGAFARALPLLEQALPAFAADSSEHFEAHTMLALAHLRSGRPADAERSMRAVLAALPNRTAGPEPALYLMMAGTVLHELGDDRAAVPLLERARNLLEATPDRDTATLALLLGNLAVARAALDQHPAALTLARRSHELMREALGDQHAVSAHSLTLVGSLERYVGELEASARDLEAAYALAQRVLPPGDSERLNAMVELAHTEAARGRAAAAIRLLEAALPGLAAGGQPAPLAEAQFALARLLGRGARGRQLAAAAAAAYEPLGRPYQRALAEVRAWLEQR